MIGFSFAVYLFHDVAEAIFFSAENIKNCFWNSGEAKAYSRLPCHARNTQTSPFH